jgi:hypothetical protein
VQFGLLHSYINRRCSSSGTKIHTIKTKKLQSMIVKSDLSRDMIGQTSIRFVLIHIGLSVHLVKWIMNCLTLVSFPVLIDGLASTFFRP